MTRIVIVGGGSAGWLAACRLAAESRRGAGALTVTLIESPDVPTIGVGEGTWPTIRRTLARIGLDEAEVLLACDASFKQGSRFDGWRTGAPGEHYYHPFVPPPEADPRDLVQAWQATAPDRPFAETVCAQPRITALGLAPRQATMPEYAGALNYAYHLDAAKLAALLARHATERLGVRYLRDHVTGVARAAGGDIAAVETRASGAVPGDLFIDCTGHAGLLIGDVCGIGLIDRGGELFNDRALVVQVPVESGSPIASQTNAIAHQAGWIWDIGLPTRRGLGCVYCSAYMSEDAAAAALERYLAGFAPGTRLDEFAPRRLTFRSQHRARFWDLNCLAIGLSAGFLEPLEASAIVLAELSIEALLDGFPASRDVMDLHAARFNALFCERWDRIVEFLKLHYLLSQRDEPYWRAHRDPATVPTRLLDLLRIWRHQPPSRRDFAAAEEVFPAASYQYVLYGMGFPPPPTGLFAEPDAREAASQLEQVAQRARVLASSLPSNRAYLDSLRAGGKAAVMEQAC